MTHLTENPMNSLPIVEETRAYEMIDTVLQYVGYIDIGNRRIMNCVGAVKSALEVLYGGGEYCDQALLADVYKQYGNCIE